MTLLVCLFVWVRKMALSLKFQTFFQVHVGQDWVMHCWVGFMTVGFEKNKSL